MNYYNEIKDNLINNEIYKRVKDYSKNRNDLETYYKVGKLLSEAGKHYGEGIINEYSKRLTKELGKGYTPTRLRYFRRYFEVFPKRPTVSDKLTFSHYCEIIWLDIDQINYYIDICSKQNLTVRQLREKIKSQEFDRLPKETKDKLKNNEVPNMADLIPDPIVIKNNSNIEIVNEKILHQLILEDIEAFMEELGNNYSFIKSEYRIKIGNKYNYIDLLLYNIEFNCYVVVELKVSELKKEYIGQIQIYMNYIDSNLRKINQDKTIGIIICKKDNKFVMEYCSDKRILSREYEVV